jgi:hypothetical protein
MRRIESDAFSSYGLKSITIPQDVDFIDGSALLKYFTDFNLN